MVNVLSIGDALRVDWTHTVGDVDKFRVFHQTLALSSSAPMAIFLVKNHFPKTSVLLHPSLIQIRYRSSDSKSHSNSFTVSYLINKCGFSQQKAISTSKTINFDSPTNPDSVLNLFTNYGFSNSDISKLMSGYPSLLLSNVDKTLKPKLDFFNSKGIHGDDLLKVLCKDQRVLKSSLKSTIIPCFDFLKCILQTDDKILLMLKRSPSILKADFEKSLEPKITLLRSHGVPDSNIAKYLVMCPRVFTICVSRFAEIVGQVQKMEFVPGQFTFLMAIHVFASSSKSSLEAKFEAYRSWGWSEDQLRSAFRKSPLCMTRSKEGVMSKMDYFVNKMGYSSSLVAKQPSVLLYSLERRIIPRCSVIQVLVTKGLVKEAPTLCSFLTWSEKVFLKFISRFEEEEAELVNAYQNGSITKNSIFL